MTTYINNTSAADSGTAVGKDPDYTGGANDDTEIVGSRHRTLDGGSYQDYVANKRTWILKWTGLTNTQWITNIRAFLITTSQLYYQGPNHTAKTAVILEGKVTAKMRKLNGDAAATPHWDVTLTIVEA